MVGLGVGLLKIKSTKNFYNKKYIEVYTVAQYINTGLQRHIKAHNNIYCKIDSLNLNKL